MTPDLEALLVRTSRTFALSIPRLPAPLREQVTVAYLLFRVADTLEDAFRWERTRRLAALDAFAALLRGEADASTLAASWREAPPCDHAGYLELLEAFPALVEAFSRIEPRAREAIARHALRTAEGMRAFTARADANGGLQLRDLADLRAYCYAVAGIVGELLTELFLLAEPVEAAAPALRAEAVAFGEGLQLVNIVKDAADDASEGRSFLPPGLQREAVLALARKNLVRARAYVRALQQAGASNGVVAFCALPVALAFSTLDRVERDGPGAKIDRAAVTTIAASVDAAIAAGTEAC